MMKKKIGFSIIICVIIATGFGNLSNAAASPSLHLSLQGSESNATITYGTEVNVTGWKDTDEGILSLLRYPALCHVDGEHTYYNCTGSIGLGEEAGYESLFTGRANSNIGGGIDVGDLDNDGINDIVVISYSYSVGGVWKWDYDVKAISMPSKSLIWQRTDLTGWGTIGDVNNDGKNEVLVATNTDEFPYHMPPDGGDPNMLYVLNGSTGETLWSRSNLTTVRQETIVVADVDGDNLNEVIVGSEDGLYVLNGTDGSMIWNYTEYGNVKWISSVDVDDDGINEVVALTFDTLFCLSVKNQTELWNNSYRPHTDKNLYAPRIEYINSDSYKDLVLSNYWNLIAYSLNNGTVLWTSEYVGLACFCWSKQPPEFMDINGDGYKDVFATHDAPYIVFFSGEDGTVLKQLEGDRNHYQDVDYEKKQAVVSFDEMRLRVAMINSTGDMVWNVDVGVGVYTEYQWPLGMLTPEIMGNYVFTVIDGAPIHDHYLVLMNLSDGYIFRKYTLPSFSQTDFAGMRKVDIDGDGIEEIILPTANADVYIINKSLLYENEIYEPSQTLDPGVYNYTLNWYNAETGESESLTRTLTVLNETVKEAPPVLSITTDAGAAHGGTDTVPIVVDDGGDNMSLGSGIINVTYNSSVVHVTNVATGAGNALPVQNWTADNTAGWVIITSADGSEAHNGTVVFANVTYEAVGSCGDSSPLNINVTSLTNWYTYLQIPCNVSNGTFTIPDDVDVVEPSVTNPSASRATILNDNGRPRVPGTNISQLNISVTDDAAVDTVTVDLSSTGGSAAEEMIKIPGTDIWTVTVNAPAGIGINLTHNLIVTATDTYGNANNSVTIPLTVLRLGDIVRDNVVDDGDMLYIAKHIVGKELAPDEFVAGVFPADSYDGVDDADMLYIAKYIVGKETAP